MKKTAMLSLFGPDAPGMIAAATGVLRSMEINLEDVSMTILENQLAMMLILSGKTLNPAVIVRRVEQALNKPEVKSKRGKKVQSAPVFAVCREISLPRQRGIATPRSKNPHLVHVIGQDQTGIVHAVSRELAALRLNITNLHSQILWRKKSPLYALGLEFELPLDRREKVILRQLKRRMGLVAKKKGLECTIKPIEVLQSA